MTKPANNGTARKDKAKTPKHQTLIIFKTLCLCFEENKMSKPIWHQITTKLSKLVCTLPRYMRLILNEIS